MQKLVFLSGAGMSAESGISVFRGADGLWEKFSIEDVASPSGWNKHPKVVLEFYNQRRKQMLASEPNAGHRIIAEMESDYDVTIITQNIDDLHERAGSTDVIHIHGEIMKAQSVDDPNRVYPIDGWELNWGDTCELGTQLRPNVVWFGEAVPLMDQAAEVVAQADVLVIIGTSLLVYPAAGLIDYCSPDCQVFCIDPEIPALPHRNPPIVELKYSAGEGMQKLRELLKK